MAGFLNEDDLDGMNPFVASLAEESRKICVHTGGDQMSPWIFGDQERVDTRSKLGSRRLSQPKDKEHRSVNTPRKLISRLHHGRNEFDFKHHADSRMYMEEYRNAKLRKQDAVLRDIILKNDRRKSSDSGLNCSPSDRQSEKPVESLPQPAVDRPKANPLIVISSKGSRRPCNLPLEGHFQGRKLHCRPQILPRTAYIHRESLRHQSGGGGCGSTTNIYHLDNSSPLGAGIHDGPSAAYGENKQPFSLSTMKAAVQCTSETRSAKSSISATVTGQTSPSQLTVNISTAIEKCDSWVKNRDLELHRNVKTKDRLYRSQSATNVSHVSSRASSTKGRLNLTKSETASSDVNHPLPSKPPSNIDYSHYTDMFKNVLEFYGPKRLRPKSNMSLDHQMVALKS